jgi:hypothetical protein
MEGNSLDVDELSDREKRTSRRMELPISLFLSVLGTLASFTFVDLVNGLSPFNISMIPRFLVF